jgi:23S rRNA pseudouridine955/2504/2580 synthase
VLVAKKRSVLKPLHEAFRGDGIDKRYLALAMGKWPAHLKEINAPLNKNELKSGERMVSVHADGKASVTRFAVIERFEHMTLIEAKPITGRTHQIRVHAQFAGHALAGDPKYGRDEDNSRAKEAGLKRLFLHSASISCFFPHLKRQLKFEAPLPPELESVLDNLRLRK